MKYIALLFLIFIPLSSEWDLSLSAYFFDKENNSFSSFWGWSFLYTYGLIPGQILGLGSFLLLLISFFLKRLIPYRKLFLLLFLTLVVGSLLITHAALKDHWGRPRPRQITEFGGTYPFFPFYKPNFSLKKALSSSYEKIENFRSFPCGHCTMGFYFFALDRALRRLGKKRLARIAWVFAMTLGILLSISRIASGGHFLSDALASFMIMWLTAASLDALLFKKGPLLASNT